MFFKPFGPDEFNPSISKELFETVFETLWKTGEVWTNEYSVYHEKQEKKERTNKGILDQSS